VVHIQPNSELLRATASSRCAGVDVKPD
jgi:hypothetical protein